MKKILVLLLTISIVIPVCAQARGIITPTPDLKDYITLKCDFHTHTVFSDGDVWPNVRINEAYREGLDVIAITDHIEYRPHIKDLSGSLNRSYEIAQEAAKSKGIIVIRGSEITRNMPPGHSNALFLTDVDKLDQREYMDAFRAAKAQNAFIFWNHPQWDAQQPDVTLWWPEHTQLLEQGFMQGIEVVNGAYSPEAHRWCLEKKLTMLGNSDIHAPMQVYNAGQHRTMTLVFARSKTPEAVFEALIERRTAVYHNDFIIGEEIYLKGLFEKSVEIKVTKTGNEARITFINKSEFKFNLRTADHDERLTYLRNYNLYPYVINPQSTQTITVRLNKGIESGDVNFIVENLLVEPETGMKYTVRI